MQASELISLAAVAFGVATFGSLVGAGGGFLLMPILLFMYPAKTQEELTFVSLFAVLVNAVAATHDYVRMKRVDVHSGLILGLATVLPAIGARFLLHAIDRSMFSRSFGLVLIVIGVLLLWRVFRRKTEGDVPPKPAPPHWFHRQITDAYGDVHEYAYNLKAAIAAAAGAGFIGSFMGIGGGVFLVPILTQILGFPARIAVATSIMVLALNSATAILTDTARHLATGGFGDLPLLAAAAVGVGALLGARCGTRLSTRVSGKGVLALLAIAIVLAGGRLVLTGNGQTAPPEETPPAETENPPVTRSDAKAPPAEP